MEVLSSRVIIAPLDFEASLRWYTETLGLRIYREFGAGGRTTGVVLFLGGGFLELSGSGSRADDDQVTMWLQVPDVDVEHDRLADAGVTIVRPPERMPWGLVEMWITDPDGHRFCLVEVPEDHPIRRRLD